MIHYYEGSETFDINQPSDCKIDCKNKLQIEGVEIENGTSTQSVGTTYSLNDIDVDEAMQIVVEGDLKYDTVRDRALLWKIDLYLMPVVCLLYCIQFMDKLSNSFGSILGLETDLKMTGNMYSWTGSAFYLGYLFFTAFTVRILQRFPVAKCVAAFVVLWGSVLCLQAAANYSGLIALRCMLGMFESIITPAFVIITSQYYRKEEMFLRTTLWLSANGFGAICGAGIAYGIVKYERNPDLAPWKYMFLITGVLSICSGVLVFVHLPDTPATAWFFTSTDKKALVARIRDNQQGFGNKQFKWYQFREAFKDLNTYLLFLYALVANIPNGGVTNFGSILLRERFKATTERALLLQMPGGAVEFLGCTALAFVALYLDVRLPIAMFGMALNIIATCLLAFSKNDTVMYVGFVMLLLLPMGFICVLSCISSNVAGHTKKTTVNGIVLVGYCIGNLIGPQTFLATEAPRYQTAIICMISCDTVGFLILAALFVSYTAMNRNKAATKVEVCENSEFADLTDRENPLFRYTI